MPSMKKLLLITGLLLISAAAGAQDARQKLLILRPELSLADGGTPLGTDQDTHNLIYDNLYQFISLLPFAEILPLPAGSPGQPSELARSSGAAFIIYGQLILSGPSEVRQAEIRLRIWSSASRSDILNRVYRCAADLELFDTLDRMVLDTVQSVFRITPRFASLSFQDFDIARDTYTIQVNNRVLGHIDSPTFSLNRKILAGTPYNIMLIRDRDQAIVYNQFILLRENQITNISYQARGQARIGPYPVEKTGHRLLLDGHSVQPGDTILELPVSVSHQFLVTDKNNRILKKKTFLLLDGEQRTLNLSPLAWQPGLRVYTGAHQLAGLGFDFTLNQNLRLGLESGYSLVSLNPALDPAHLLYMGLDLGLRLFRAGPLDFSAGAGGGWYLPLAMGDWYLVSSQPPQGLLTRAYVQAGWRFLYLRAGLSLDLRSGIVPGLVLSLGLRW